MREVVGDLALGDGGGPGVAEALVGRQPISESRDLAVGQCLRGQDAESLTVLLGEPARMVAVRDCGPGAPMIPDHGQRLPTSTRPNPRPLIDPRKGPVMEVPAARHEKAGR
jgi:hypothetical protein